MPLINLSAPPSQSTLRWFGLSLGVVLVLLAWGLSRLPWFPARSLAITGVVVTSIYYAAPATRLGIVRSWQYITFPLAWLMGHVLLASIFFLILTPIAWILRLRKHDPLNLRKPFDGDDSSNWCDKPNKDERASVFRQF